MSVLPRPPDEVLAGLPAAVVAYLEALEALVDEVALAVRRAAGANLDEVGWWQGKTRSWLWTAVTETLTLVRLDPSRGKAVVQALLGAEWIGIMGSDRSSA